ncbi:hypothetical protein B0H21DRAFT_779564 [Amylocystis lapponica]|nr:hypothetical protein B0H21DRAFT_779564 [Amylocystis lapponica]
MASFHLRPVSDRSTSPSTSTSTTSERSPPHSVRTSAIVVPPRSSTPGGRSRLPLSPSTLRDVDLSMDKELAQRNGYFEREERAFFAQAGKEKIKTRRGHATPPTRLDCGLHLPPTPHPHSPHQLSPGAPPPMPFPHSAGRVRAAPVPVTPQTVFPAPPKGHPPPPPLDTCSPPTRPPPCSRGVGPQLDAHADEFRDDPDEAWRRPCRTTSGGRVIVK